MKLKSTALFFVVWSLLATECALACSSALIARDATRDGRMLLWKHRDSGFADNFVGRVEATDSTMAYVALFNAGDNVMREAWVGFNSAGFAVMNTASYNLAPDTATVRDREGVLMSLALGRCRNVDDFRRLLDEEIGHGTLGVQANFGVMDAEGNGAYFETSDHFYTVYDLASSSDGSLVRSNYSYSGGENGKLGAVRHDNTVHLLQEPLGGKCMTPEYFTERMSRSFYHSGFDKDMWHSPYSMLTDRGEYIPRRSSCASVVIEGCRPGEDAAASTVMWVMIGFPTASHVEPVTLDSIPACLLPSGPDGHSALCDEVNRRRARAFPRKGKEGKWLFDMNYLRSVVPEQRKLSDEGYRKGRALRERGARSGK